MRFTSHILSKYLSNQTEILHTYRGVNVVICCSFWVHSIKGVWTSELGDLKVKKYFEIFPMFLKAGF